MTFGFFEAVKHEFVAFMNEMKAKGVFPEFLPERVVIAPLSEEAYTEITKQGSSHFVIGALVSTSEVLDTGFMSLSNATVHIGHIRKARSMGDTLERTAAAWRDSTKIYDGFRDWINERGCELSADSEDGGKWRYSAAIGEMQFLHYDPRFIGKGLIISYIKIPMTCTNGC